MDVTALLERASAREPEIPDWHAWGVWSLVDNRFLSTAPSEKDAWIALLESDYPYPWELRLRLVPDEDADEDEPDEDGDYPCPKCAGDGSCSQCDEECRMCEGTGYISQEEHAAWVEIQESRKRRRRKLAEQMQEKAKD